MNRLGDFLRARRALLQPDDVGLRTYRPRRVPGLRREELASLAGVSPAYYTRLEQGRDQHPSPSVVRALARALQLDVDATEYLLALGSSPPPELHDEPVSATLSTMLEAGVSLPGFIVGRRLDVLAANASARLLHPSFRRGRNLLRDAFLDDEARSGYAELARVQEELTASLRVNLTETGSSDVDAFAADLASQSPGFARLWTRHEIRRKAQGTKTFVHPTVGVLALEYTTLAVEGADRQLLVIYDAAAGSTAASDLRMIIDMAATAFSASGPVDAPQAPAPRRAQRVLADVRRR